MPATAFSADPQGEPETPETLALADLVAAGQVSHEMICDPEVLGAEAPALNRLCALIAGEIYRIGPFHYAFHARAEDMEGALGLIPVDDWTGMIEAALRAELGAGAVWLYPTDLLSEALALEGTAGAPAGTDVPETAGALEARLAELVQSVGQSLGQSLAGGAERLARIEAKLETLLARLDAGETRHDLLGEHLAEHLTLRLGESLGDRLGDRLGAGTDRVAEHMAERASAEAAFEEKIGLALAEFVARIERAVAESAPRPR